MRLPIALLLLVNGVAKAHNQFLQFFLRYIWFRLFHSFYKLRFRFDPRFNKIVEPLKHSPFALKLFLVGARCF